MLKRLPILFFIFIICYYFFKDHVYDQKEILVGASLPKSGIIKSWGNSVINGANSYFNYANEYKLLGENKIKFITYDDKYEPELTIENLKRLIFEDNIFTLFGFVGTPTVKTTLPILDDEKVPLFAPFTGASFLRNNNINSIINFRSSYQEEIETLVEYLTTIKNLKKFAVFYQNDDFGEEGYVSILNSLNKRSYSLVAEGSYKRNTLSINHAFNEIKDVKPEVILMIGAYKTNALFIKKAKENENLRNTIFCNISFGDANAIVNELKELNSNTTNLIFSQIVPSYDDTSIDVVNEYKFLMRKYYPKEEFSFISLEAFLAAKVLVNAINNIRGDKTREKLLFTLKNTNPNLLKGLTLEYKNNQLLNKIHLFEYKNDEFVEIKYEK